MALALSRIGRTSLGLLRPGHKIQLVPSATMGKFWEPDHRGGYDTKEKLSPIEAIRKGAPQLLPEIKMWSQEWKSNMRMDNVIPIKHGDYEILWRFDNPETIKDWVVTADSEHEQGNSKAEFILGRNKRGIFQGYIDTEPPKDGVTKNSGYANIKSPKKFVSFKRERAYDWYDYTHLVIRTRGDGRPYNVVLQMSRYFDMQWHDQYHYPLFTRGGPYWQYTTIPFSKFMLVGKGKIQDKQRSLVEQLDRIQRISITLGDGVKGHFQMEIDYIAVMFDANHKEHFAYEMYQVDPSVHSG